MDKTKIKELLNKETIPTQEEFFEFFEVKTRQELVNKFLDNLSHLIYEFNDSISTRIIEEIFQQNREGSMSIIGERVSLGALFISTYSEFDYDLLQLYVYAFGMTESAFLLDYALKDDPRYNFLLNLYKEYKTYYFGDSYAQILNGIEAFMRESADDAREINFDELSKTLKDLEEKIK